MSTEDTAAATAADPTPADAKPDKAAKVPVHLKFAGELERVHVRLSQVKSGNFIKIAGRLDTWIEAADTPESKAQLVELKNNFNDTLTSLADVVANLKALPESFSSRARTSSGKSAITVGVTVGIVEKHLSKYDGIIPEGVLQNLKVAGFRKGYAMVKDPDGMPYMIPKAHVEVVAATEASD